MERHQGRLVFRVRPGDGEAATILLLHGLTGDEDSMTVFVRRLPRAAAVFTVRAPHPVEFQGFTGYGWFQEEDRGNPERASLRESFSRLEDFLDEDLPRFGGRRDRLFLMGFSQGAFMSYLLTFRLEPRPLGLVAMSSMAPRSELLGDRSLESLPALLLHGIEDSLVPAKEGRQASELLRQAGAEVIYREYPTGHKVTREGMQEIANWFVKRLGSR